MDIFVSERARVIQDVGIPCHLPTSFQVDVCVGMLDKVKVLTQLHVCGWGWMCVCHKICAEVWTGRVEEWAVYEVLLISCSKVCRHVSLPDCPAVSVCVQSFVRRINPCVSLQDFRDAVAKATRQNGKPVVDERILCQILYYLPQLYQLNKDLLRELEERVAHW